MRGTAYRLNLLDTAGQERFRTLSNSYYRGAHGVVLVYDISGNRDSFMAMDRWYEEAESNAMPGAVTYLVSWTNTPEYTMRALMALLGWQQMRQVGFAGRHL